MDAELRLGSDIVLEFLSVLVCEVEPPSMAKVRPSADQRSLARMIIAGEARRTLSGANESPTVSVESWTVADTPHP